MLHTSKMLAALQHGVGNIAAEPRAEDHVIGVLLANGAADDFKLLLKRGENEIRAAFDECRPPAGIP